MEQISHQVSQVAHSPFPRRCWTTLVTRTSYLAGALLLARSLQRHGSAFPLVLFYTPATLPRSSVDVLLAEARLNPSLRLRTTAHLLPPRKVSVVASRFEDTWTKLRCFALYDGYAVADDGATRKKQDQTGEASVAHDDQEESESMLAGFDEACYLDADMLVLRAGMDEIFTNPDLTLPPNDAHGRGWIAATHACVCNLDQDPWAAADWTRANCAYTPLRHPQALSGSTPVPRSEQSRLSSSTSQLRVDVTQGTLTPIPRTHTLLNSGLFVFRPSKRQYHDILEFLSTSPLVKTFAFPDQDLITEFFRDRWLALPWKFNALKTWRYWHGPRPSSAVQWRTPADLTESVIGPAAERDPYTAHPALKAENFDGIWRDEEVVNLHYIVDKPWSSRVHYLEKADPQTRLRKVAGFMDTDGETHAWWWREWDQYVLLRRRDDERGQHADALAQLVAQEGAAPMEGSADAIKSEKQADAHRLAGEAPTS